MPSFSSAALAFTAYANSYYVFIMATLALTAIVGIGLNILLGLAGQVSFGHVGFYAIGAYAVAILTTAREAGASGSRCRWRSLLVRRWSARCSRCRRCASRAPTSPWSPSPSASWSRTAPRSGAALTGGQNGIMGVPTIKAFGATFGERGVALLAIALCALLTFALLAPVALAPGARRCAR